MLGRVARPVELSGQRRGGTRTCVEHDAFVVDLGLVPSYRDQRAAEVVHRRGLEASFDLR
jgi:hypothetical protein